MRLRGSERSNLFFKKSKYNQKDFDVYLRWPGNWSAAVTSVSYNVHRTEGYRQCLAQLGNQWMSSDLVEHIQSNVKTSAGQKSNSFPAETACREYTCVHVNILLFSYKRVEIAVSVPTALQGHSFSIVPRPALVTNFFTSSKISVRWG